MERYNNNWYRPDPNDEFQSLIHTTAHLSIVDVLEHHGVLLSKRGYRYIGLCPFHMDNKPGSWSVDSNKNINFCYSCGCGGGPIKTIQQMYNLDFKDAVLQLACDEGIIDTDTYERLSGLEYSDEFLTKYSNKYSNSNISVLEKKRPDSTTIKMWTDIYTYIQKRWTLKPYHLKMLQEERQLSDTRIASDYFTIKSTNPDDVHNIIVELKKEFPQYKEQLASVPGFYEMEINGRWIITMLQFSGIGILIRNAYGEVIGIQIRMDNKDENGLRYKFFSYMFGTSNSFVRGGGSCGTPIDIVYPKQIKDTTKVAIAEGRFKTEILAEQGLIGLSVQGVNNYSGIEKDLLDLENILGHNIDTVTLFYDADLVHNIQVYKAAINLGKYLAEKKPNTKLQIAVWNEVFGKGIDDMIIAGYRNEVKFISFDTFCEIFDICYDKSMKESGLENVLIKDISKEKRNELLKVFGRYVWELM